MTDGRPGPLTADPFGEAGLPVPGFPEWGVVYFFQPGSGDAEGLLVTTLFRYGGRPVLNALWSPSSGWRRLDGSLAPGGPSDVFGEALASDDLLGVSSAALAAAAGSVLLDPASLLLSLEVMSS